MMMFFKKLSNLLESGDVNKGRYQNPSRPEGYRQSKEFFKCSNCDFSIRSNNEGAIWYCQKYQVDVADWTVCDNYHASIY